MILGLVLVALGEGAIFVAGIRFSASLWHMIVLWIIGTVISLLGILAIRSSAQQEGYNSGYECGSQPKRGCF